MAMKTLSYAQARPLMKAGDVIAFSGKGHFSEVIKLATRSGVSHVGVVLQTQVMEIESGKFFNQIIESATIRGFSGVSISLLSERLDEYEGDIWWLPIQAKLTENPENHKAFYNFLFQQAKLKKPYDFPQAVQSAVDAMDELPFGLHGPGYNREDFSRFFCSELVAAALERAKIVGTINASEVTPIDLCRWNIYEQDYYLLKQGNPDKPAQSITRFNSMDPALWNL
ncbi:hypothetical protein Mmc1_1692 [Magnetococcus marinus MC-1]|uniref:Permuted papain-like amidase YaeF/Yiix C92 family enzyme n=1 Tax=Magnetococcus marinus (strain ATCC BAA-1437 / JCM 17883 / MC-1) TaxID=156889 RepID=A0L8A8_MAGMM|nr:hypothetical protein [Magnetococcus marinus]ABK44201.1 hypothetical protein Mmc1_1692 [Magnetococcus marinus MC-1]